MTANGKPGIPQAGIVCRAVGDILIALTALFTVYLCVVMTRRIGAVVLKDIYRKIFHHELILCAVLILFALDLRFGFWTAFGPRALQIAGWVPRIAVAALTAVILLFTGRVVAGGMIRTAPEAENVIVLGMALENGEPSRDLIGRLDTAEKYLNGHPGARLILTGGNPDEAGLTEAGVMRRILLDRGVPEDRLILEDQAESTRDNFINTARLIGADGPVALITSSYHMDRALRMARDAGFRDCQRLPAPSDPVTYASNVLWEVILDINEVIRRG